MQYVVKISGGRMIWANPRTRAVRFMGFHGDSAQGHTFRHGVGHGAKPCCDMPEGDHPNKENPYDKAEQFDIVEGSCAWQSIYGEISHLFPGLFYSGRRVFTGRGRRHNAILQNARGHLGRIPRRPAYNPEWQ